MYHAPYEITLEVGVDGVTLVCRDAQTQQVLARLPTRVEASREVIDAFNTDNQRFWQEQAEAQRVHAALLAALADAFLPPIRHIGDPLRHEIRTAIRGFGSG